jgi:uncharacterized protein YutE (UPF0331/DUF86 family)
VTDRDVILRKLTSLRDHAGRVRRRRPAEVETFRDDVDRQDATSMSLLVAVQNALDIALHLVSDEGWGVPASYAESFELLREHQVVDARLSQELINLATLRNRLAHGYGTVDVDRLWRELPDGLSALDAFASAIAAHLGRPTNRQTESDAS